MSRLTKAQLLAADRPRAVVNVPELGGEVVLQAPSAGEWLAYQRWLGGLEADSLDHVTRIVAITAIDEEGKPLLTDEDCRELPYHVLVRLSRAALELTKTSAEVETAKGES